MQKFYLNVYRVNFDEELLPFVLLNVNNSNKENIINKAYQDVDTIWNAIEQSDCPTGAINKYAFPRGNTNGMVMIVAQNPGGRGVRDYKTIWADGPNSKYLMDVVHEAGIFDEVWFTNLVPYATADNRITSEQIKETEFLIKKQVEIIQPKVLIGLGGVVNQNLKRIFGKQIPIIELNHPAYMRRFKSGDPNDRIEYIKAFTSAKQYFEEKFEEKMEAL